MKVKLQKPLKHKGQDLTELDISLENLTGTDLIEVEKQLQQEKIFTLMPDYAKVYLIRVAARAAHIPAEVLEGLSARDFTAVTSQVQNFLMAPDSGTADESSNLESETKTQGTGPETSSGE